MKGRVLVKIIPIHGSRIRFLVQGRVFCTRLGSELKPSVIVSKDDAIATSVLGSKNQVDKFLHRNRPIKKVTTLGLLGYSVCDRII